MIASRDIQPGEVIFDELPLTFGPSDNSRPVCLGCYERIKSLDEAAICMCGYPMCSKTCSDVPQHRDFECKAFIENGFKV
jgi:hypothetical protein